ncbi:thiol:disulfide interchange protein DsbA/DsbL [Shewanella sp. 202IG2-18]|uniref:thiol:disulfide interchange protein DsbA/DsbL n=1 Tax=Parashewanella hymeniacidonis TaxID=2807618 RepID=UPI00195F398A|nr:thiol:disulfide interchange protein DsbA/DsbL [Parashewanella hymeniacidonis]MBM7071201.1 thiol:disulfide interchange protein DsbA/DsbL [Parashewanella hymeniacidonis]
MKKWFLALTLMVSFASGAKDFTEGTHYSKLDTPQPTASPTITEYFSFFCGHCFRFSTSTAHTLKSNLPESIKFRQVHTFIPNHVTEDLTKAYVLAERLGKEKPVESKIFNAIHVKRKRPTNASDVEKMVIDAGVSPSNYKEANAFTIRATVAKQGAEIKKLGITTIPDLIVNGRYRIHRPSLKSDNELVELIQHLASK